MVIVGKFKGRHQKLWIRDDIGSQYHIELDEHRLDTPRTYHSVYEQDPDTQQLTKIASGYSSEGFTGAMGAAIEAIRIYEELTTEECLPHRGHRESGDDNTDILESLIMEFSNED